MTRRQVVGFVVGVASLATVPATCVYIVGVHVLELIRWSAQ